MSPGTVLLQTAAVFAIVLLNAFFVAAEFAIVKVRATQIEPLARGGSRRAEIAHHITEHLDIYLSSCQLGITMTSLGLGWVGEPFVADLLLLPLGGVVSDGALLHTIAFVIAFSFITSLHIVIGEQAPKWVAIQHARGTTLAVARPLDLFTRLFRPAIWILNASAQAFLRFLGVAAVGEGEVVQSEEELKLILSKGKAITKTGKSISLRALALRDRTVREIMIPRTSVVFLSTERSMEQNIHTAVENQFTRYPLCEKNLDNVIGMIHIKDLIRWYGTQGSGARLLEAKRELLFVPETMPLEELLNLFLARRILMAVAVDEYGGTAGMVTLEDVLEEVVGEIRDEFDTESGPVQKVSETEFLVEGSMPLSDFAATFVLPIETKDVVTASGYLFQLLGRIPEKGAQVPLGPWRATVEAVERRKVKSFRMVRAPEPPALPPAEGQRKKKGGRK